MQLWGLNKKPGEKKLDEQLLITAVLYLLLESKSSVNLVQATTKSIIPLQLFPDIRVLKEKETRNESNIIPQVFQLLLRYGVSEECYHDIAQVIGGPKSYKVICVCASV